MDPQGVRRESLGVLKDHKSKVIYPFTPLFQLSRGPQVELIDALGVHGTFFNF